MDLSFFAAYIPAISFSTDIIVLCVLAAVFLFDSLRTGTTKATALTLSLPIALLLYQYTTQAALIAPFAARITTPSLSVALYAAILFVVFLAFYRITDGRASDSAYPVQAMAATVAGVIMFSIVWQLIPMATDLWNFGPMLQNIFGEAYRFWWLLVALFALAVSRA